MDILFFPTVEERYSGSQLKAFLSFLTSQGRGPSFKFAFMDTEGSLLPKLTLRENIYLDSIVSFMTNSKKDELEQFIQKTGNVHLSRFYRDLTRVDELSEKVDDQSRKKAALFKAFLQDSDYLLLEYPEKYLDNPSRELVVKILKFYAVSSDKQILLSGPHLDMWRSCVSKLVFRNSDKSFEVCPVSDPSAVVVSASKSAAGGRLSFSFPENPKNPPKKTA